MQRAFIVGILLAVITPSIDYHCFKKNVYDRRCTFSCLFGRCCTGAFAWNQSGIWSGCNLCRSGTWNCIEAIRKKFQYFIEMAISVIMSAGIGLAGVLSGFVQNSANFNSFLFGSIFLSVQEKWQVFVSSVLQF